MTCLRHSSVRGSLGPSNRLHSSVRATAVVVAAILTGIAAAPAVAQDRMPPLVPIEHFFDNPEVAGAQISPDGRWLSYLRPYEGKLNVFIRPVDAETERQMTADTIRPVTGYFWSIDSSRLLYVQDKGGNENYHVYSVPLDGGSDVPEARDLTPFEGARAVIFAVPRDLPDRILVGLNNRDPSVFDAHWLDLETGELELAAENPGRHLGYILDHEERVRVAVGQDQSGGTEIYARDDESGDWRTVASYPADENVSPIRFHKDNRRLYMSSDHGDTNLSRLVLLDVETGEVEVVESDPEGEVDFGQASFSDVTNELVATVYVADTVRIYPKNEQVARDLERLRQVHGGTPGISSETLDERKAIVAFNEPTDPGATYLYDRETGEAEFLFRPRPWLESEHLAHMQPVSFEARDGMTIHGYLSTPRGVTPLNLPLVLVVHGGPWARDSWGYQPEVQMLANRGYAVLQINYRGSTGYGKEFYNAAVKEWAGAMHDDLVDGVRWAVEEGIADPDRVGIYGGSYGGYATLVGLTFTPEVFTCGVDYVGPSSLITLIESFPAYWRPFLEGSFYRHVGDPADPEERADMKRRSPLFHVDRIEDPLMIVQGANDPRVTKRESDQMALALRDRGIDVQYLVAENEGHGFANADNRMALYRAMEEFFGECLEGRVQEEVPAAIEEQIAKLSVDVDTLTLEAEVSYREVGVADPLLDPSWIHEDSQQVRLTLVQGGQEREIGSSTQSVAFTEVDGRPAIRKVDTVESPMIGSTADTALVDRETLAPLSLRSHNPNRTAALEFDGARLSGSVQPASGEARMIDETFDATPFLTETVGLAVRALRLEEGLAVELPVYLTDQGTTGTAKVVVTGVESVEVEGRPVEAWVVQSTIAGQEITTWLARDDHRQLKSLVTIAPGVELRVERM